MTVAVVLLTYNRLSYAKTTLKSAAKFLESNEHDFVWHIASDGDGAKYIDDLLVVLEKGIGNLKKVTVSNSKRGGYGKNYNLAMQAVHPQAEWIMPLEDDWELTRTFNPDGLIRDMKELEIGCARLGYIGYTQVLRGHFAYGKGAGHWFVLDPESPEPHVFAGHPRIEALSWARRVGPWAEGLLPGETEFEVAHRKTARVGVAWPLDVAKPSGDLFVHIGSKRSY